MRSKLLGALLLIVVFMFGCGSKEASEPVEQTLIEEESTTGEELSFALINDSITLECGTPFDKDISKYVKADNIENIEMEIDDMIAGREQNFEVLGQWKGTNSILFKDKTTQDELAMTLNYEDTIAPVISFEKEDTLPFYTMLPFTDVSSGKMVTKIVKRVKGNGVDGLLGSFNMDGTINSVKIAKNLFKLTTPKDGENYEINFEFTDNPISKSTPVENYEFFLENDEEKTSIDYSVLPEAGIYEYTLNVKDSGGNIGSVKFKVNVIDDISPENREYMSSYLESLQSGTDVNAQLEKMIEECRNS